MGVLGEQGAGGHDLAGGADTTLEATVVDEGALEWVKLAVAAPVAPALPVATATPIGLAGGGVFVLGFKVAAVTAGVTGVLISGTVLVSYCDGPVRSNGVSTGQTVENAGGWQELGAYLLEQTKNDVKRDWSRFRNWIGR